MASTMFKRKANRNLRQKRGSDDDEQEDNVEEILVSTAATSSLSGPKISSSTNLMSFADDDEGIEEFNLKKKARDQKKQSRLQRKQQLLEEFDCVSASATESSRQELTATTFSTTVSASKVGGKPLSTQIEITRISVHQKFAEDISGEDAGEKPDDTRSFQKLLSSGVIPDANVIHMAKKKREMARTLGDVTSATGAEFVPLDDTRQFKAERSRLVRDDDNDASDLDEEGGKFFSSKLDKDEEHRRAQEAAFLRVEQGDSGSEEVDDEFEQWEKEQLKKAVTNQQFNSYQQEQQQLAFYQFLGYNVPEPRTTFAKDMFVSPMHRNRPHIDSPHLQDVSEPAPMDVDIDFSVEKESSLPKLGGGQNVPSAQVVSLDTIRDRLKQQLEEKQQNYRGQVLQRDKVQDSLMENYDMIGKLEELLPRLKSDYEFYQEMRVYIKDLLHCFDTKVPTINRLEEEMMKLYQKRCEFISLRRRQDVEDQYDECQAAANGVKLTTITGERKQRMAERESRRTRRRQAREMTVSGIGHHDGLSSDDEETPSRVAQFSADKEAILAERDTIFSDTIDEFANTRAIVDRLSQWSLQQRSSFQKAYIALCLPKLFSPLIRLYLISWNPLEVYQNLDAMTWFRDLLWFGFDPNDAPDSDVTILSVGDDAIVNLIPNVIEKVICPKLKDLVDRVWDPMSATQTKNLARLLKDMRLQYPSFRGDVKLVQALIESLVAKFKKSINADAFMPIFLKSSVENKSTGAAAYLDRQFWFCFKLMTNVIEFECFLSDDVIIELAVDGVLNRFLVLGLQCCIFSEPSTLVKARSIAKMIPSRWFGIKTNDSTLKQLEPFCKALYRMIEEITSIAGVSLDRTIAKESIKELYKVLIKLNAFDFASKVTESCKIMD